MSSEILILQPINPQSARYENIVLATHGTWLFYAADAEADELVTLQNLPAKHSGICTTGTICLSSVSQL